MLRRIKELIFRHSLPVLLLALGGAFLFAPNSVSAALTFPATPCDFFNAVPAYHLSDLNVQEDGTVAFRYGADNNSFVTIVGDTVTFHIQTFLPTDSPQPLIRFAGFAAGCGRGYGTAFHTIVLNGENTIDFNRLTYEYRFNSGPWTTLIPAAGGTPVYFWIEVFDDWQNPVQAAYSYLVDINNPQNPSGQAGEPAGKRPVLIVPGILGTELWNGSDHIWADLQEMAGDINDQFISDNLMLYGSGNSIQTIGLGPVIEKIFRVPIFEVDIFESLRLALEQSGYILNQNLFFHAYDWRLDLNQTKDQLQQKIEAIKAQTGFFKVNFIAHSMGGLLTKSYLDAYGQDNIDKLIFIGTPHLGAPKAAKVLLEGDRFGIPWLEEDRMAELAVNSPASYELLPSPKYFDEFTGYIKKFGFLTTPPPLDYTDTKDFLLNDKGLNGIAFTKAENLFSKNLSDLDFSDLDVYNIAGCKTGTQAGYHMTAFGNIGLVKYTSGDGTVPLPSADYINVPATHKYFVKNGDHSELPSTGGVRELIVDILEGIAPTLAGNVSGYSDFCNFKGKEALFRSPVEVHIYSQGKHTGPIENNAIEYGIPGVSYDVIDGEKFIFLPTDESQNYQIQGIGEGQGTFDLLISEVDDGNILNTQVFNDVPISTSTPIDFSISETSQDNQIQVNNQTVEADARLTPEQADDLVAPETTAIITGTQGNNGWHTSDVEITLTAADDNSGVFTTHYRLAGGVWQECLPPPSPSPQGGGNCPQIFITEGVHTLEFYSVDKAGNNEVARTLEIKIDKTAPEFIVWFDFASKAYKFIAQDNLDPGSQMICASTNCNAQDAAGNTTILTFKKIKILNTYALILSTISYNGNSAGLTENLFTVGLFGKNLQNSGQAAWIKKQQIAAIGYTQNKNESKIVESQANGTLKTYVLNGLHLIKLKTNKQNINVKIE